uniref:Histone deacetylase 2 n=1 Tax=Rhizophora mucronata TaxID=61149 RepID=A0A2P2MIN9_RHIMU
MMESSSYINGPSSLFCKLSCQNCSSYLFAKWVKKFFLHNAIRKDCNGRDLYLTQCCISKNLKDSLQLFNLLANQKASQILEIMGDSQG